jgi:hypothetical protein
VRALSYLLIWIPAAMLGSVASFSVLSLSNTLDLRYLPYWVELAMNFVPAFVSGVGCYYFAARLWRPEHGSSATSAGHFLRAVPLYLIGAFLIALLWSSRLERDIGLWAQFAIWPLAATLGGVVGDLLGGGGRPGSRRTGAG